MAGPSLEGLINPDLLRWAREQSRLDLAAAGSKVNKTGPQLAQWENGEKTPTLNQLRTLANPYRRSVGVFS